MKKGKIFTKGQIAVGVMILGLAAAVWLNAKYLPTETKYLGEASYVNATTDNDAVETSAKVKEAVDCFTEAKATREEARDRAMESVEEMLDTESLSDADKSAALDKVEQISKNIEKEANIEALLISKGFKKAVAVISDNGITVTVLSDGLTSAQTLQIQDIVTSETDISLDKIKIVPVKE